MTDYKKLVDALHTIQDECKLYVACDDCPLYGKNIISSCICGLHYKTPADWKIKQVDVIQLFEGE